MPHRQAFREVFDPQDLLIATRAYDKALAFLTESGDADGDPNVQTNLAQQIIFVGQETPNLTFLEMTNRAISRYRVHRAMMMVKAAKTKRKIGNSSASAG